MVKKVQNLKFPMRIAWLCLLALGSLPVAANADTAGSGLTQTRPSVAGAPTAENVEGDVEREREGDDARAAQPKSAPAPDSPGAPAVDEPAAVLAFVRQHQPKLIRLLEFLEAQQPATYHQAIKEMARSQQRLEILEKRDPALHAVELQLWQIRSELRLLAAEMSAARQPAGGRQPNRQAQREQRLAELVTQEANQELARLRLMQGRAEKELARLNEQIEAFTAEREEQIARKLQQWQTRINRSGRK